MQAPLEHQMQKGGVPSNEKEIMKLYEQGRLDSIQLNSGHTMNYSSVASTSYLGANRETKDLEESRKIREKCSSVNVQQVDPHTNRHETMKTVAQKEMANPNVGKVYSSQENYHAALAQGKTNFAMGSVRPEHHHVSMVGINRNLSSPGFTHQRVNFAQQGKGMVNPAAQVSVGNIGQMKNEKYDFKTLNQERIKWIQPVVRQQ